LYRGIGISLINDHAALSIEECVFNEKNACNSNLKPTSYIFGHKDCRIGVSIESIDKSKLGNGEQTFYLRIYINKN